MLIAQYCAHAPFKDLQRHLDELAAQMADESELLDSLGEQSLQWIEIAESGNGMWSLSGELSDETGRLLDKYLKTACPPPRQEETDAEGVLPAAPNRHAEAIHQLLAGYGSSPEAATRHGHTATLDLVVDVETLQGNDTGRSASSKGSRSRLRKPACSLAKPGSSPRCSTTPPAKPSNSAGPPASPTPPSVASWSLSSPKGCAWNGCSLPVAWTEAHHITHWADGGVTNAANLILLCRFHHGRIHTTGWTVEKTAPGQAIITHHEDHETQGDKAGRGSDGCGCSDRAPMPTWMPNTKQTTSTISRPGLYRSEWSENMKFDLDARAEAAEQDRCLAAHESRQSQMPRTSSQASQEPKRTQASPA